jgi:hypothetical protein
MQFDIRGITLILAPIPYYIRHGRNISPTERAIYGSLTVAIIPFLNVYVNKNGGIGSFTIIVNIDLGLIVKLKKIVKMISLFPANFMLSYKSTPLIENIFNF